MAIHSQIGFMLLAKSSLSSLVTTFSKSFFNTTSEKQRIVPAFNDFMVILGRNHRNQTGAGNRNRTPLSNSWLEVFKRLSSIVT